MLRVQTVRAYSRVMVLLYLSGCGPRNGFRELYWHIPLFEKEDLTECTNELL